MPENEPLSLEAIAAEHHVDIEFLRKVQEGVRRAYETEAQWRSWCVPLIAQVMDISAIVLGHPKQDIHPLDRPGLTIFQREHLGESLQLFIEVPGYARLSLQLDPLGSVSLCRQVLHSAVEGANPSTAQAIAHLNHSWSNQSELVKHHWASSFNDATQVLSRAHEALRNNTPLGPTSNWSEVLINQLAQPATPSETSARWAHWVKAWGTPEMQRSFHVVQDLLDVTPNDHGWRDHLLSFWTRGQEAPVLLRNETIHEDFLGTGV